ncbi:MAG TPA: YfhO family protein [Candidatus Sulfomarinibacteraceae bacterium]|nr:YfhO family protein [Candidatus Sulfomarinibacteraceae bacterium]
MFDPSTVRLVIGVIVGLCLTQAVLLLLSRGLGLRVHRTAVIASLASASILVAGYVANDSILLPTVVVQGALPDAPPSAFPPTHGTLSDAVFQFVPWEAEIRRSFADGRLPVWSARLDGGSSPWANPQAGALSPTAMLARMTGLEHHLLAALAFKLVIAFQGAWLFARLLGARRSHALIAGFGFALGGGIMAWALFPHSATAAWLPWLALASIRVTRRPGPQAVAATAAITALTLVSGHPETALAGGLLAAFCAVFFGRRAAAPAAAGRGVAAATVAAIIGFALASPHLLPFACQLPGTVRYQQMIDGETIMPDPTQGPLAFREVRILHGVVNPQASGDAPFADEPYWPLAGAGYAGIVALAGTCIALGSRLKRCLALAGVALILGLLAAGFRPALAAAAALPFASTINWTRMMTPIPLVLAVCGAVGLSELARRGRLSWVAAVGVAAAASLAVAPRPVVIVLWVAALAASVVVIRRPTLGVAGFAAVCLLDLFPWSCAMLPNGDPRLFYPPTPLMTDLGEVAGSRPDSRIVASGLDLYPSLAAMYRLSDARYHNPLADAAYAQVLGHALGFHPTDEPFRYMSPVRTLSPLVDYLGVAAIVSASSELPDRFTPAGNGVQGRPTVFSNPRTLPPAFVPTDIVLVDRQRTLEAVGAVTDPRVVVVANGEASSAGLSEAPGNPTRIGWTDDGLGRVVLEIADDGDRLIATSLTHPHGWRASAGKRPLRVVTVNHAFVGVVVPAGVREVELTFVPPGLGVGLAVGLIGLVSVVGLLSPGRFR